MRRAWLAALPLALLFAGPAQAVPPPKKSHAQAVCEILSREAQLKGLPEAYFARLIWKESRFDPEAVSPKGAQGIAQFMPDTARLRGLADPFKTAEALKASAHLLSDLEALFGNLGLAAAAYNAGMERVRDWLDGRRGLPAETLDYVFSITGRPASDWSSVEARFPIPAIGEGQFLTDCVKFASASGKGTARGSKAALRIANQAGGWKPWGAQLAGAPSESVALAMFEQIRKRHGDVLGGITPLVIRKRNLGMGLKPIANVRIGAATRAEAEQFCAKMLKKAIACVVMRN